jgi:gliding motility-associated-like protein
MKKIGLLYVLLFVGFADSFSQVPSYVDTNGLVGWWPFDGNANDYSGNSLNGIVNGASLTTDRFGSANSAYDYDGVNDYIQVNSNSMLDIQNTLSVSFWMFMDGGGCNPRVFYLDDCPYYNFAMYQTSNVARNIHFAGFGCNTSTLYMVNTNNSINSNSIPSLSWQHIVVTFNRGIGEGKIYLNGVLYKVFTSSSFTSPLVYNNKNFYFGNINPTRCDWWGGKIDDFGLWNKVLDSTQVKLLFQANSCNLTYNFPQDTITFCNQDSVLLDAGAGFASYNWSNGDSTQTTFAKATGMYVVQVTDTNGCSAEDSVFVNFINRNYDTVLIDQFTMTFSSFYSHSTPSLHIDSTYLVKVNGRYGYADGWSHNDAAYNYAWDTLTNTKVRCNGTQDAQKSTAWLLNGSNITFRPINDIDNNCCFCSGGNKEYVWKFQNYSGVQVFSFVDGGYGDNSGSLDFKVYVLRPSPDSIYVDTVVSCNSFLWQNGITYNASGIYSDTITDSQGCDSIISLNLTINTLSYQLPQDTITSCGQDSVLLDAGAGFSSYNWSNGDSTQMTYAKATGMYSVEVTDTNGCSAEDSVFVSIINGNILQNDTTICKGDSVSLSISQQISQALTICNGNNLPSNLQTGLVGYWPFCGNANDESGNGNNGTVNGAILTTDRFGNANSAYDFDGVNDYMDMGNNTSLHIQNNFSASFWMLMDGGVSCNPRVFNIGVTNPVYYTFAMDGISNISRNIHFWTGYGPIGPSNFPTYGTKKVSSLVWNHIVMTVQGSAGLGDIYLNGTHFQSFTTNPVTGSMNYLGNNLFIGNKDSLSCDWWGGKIDDLFLWNRVLTVAEASYLSTGDFSKTYQWSTGDTTSIISVSPDSTTTYYVTISNGIHSCVDSITVTVNNPQFQFAQDSVSGCDTVSVNAGSGWSAYSWSSGDTTQSVSFTTTGLKVLTVTDSIGCTATDSIYVTVNTYVTTTISDTSCDEYTWSQTGITYGSSGIYRDTVPTVVGCDSIIELVLTIHVSDTVRISTTACDSFTWSQTGLTYYTSGVYSDSLVNNQGCDSILLLDLTISQTTSSTISAAACDSFTWLLNGMTYNSSGVYSDTLTTSQGCDSIVSLNLTINTLSYQLPQDTITSCGQDSVLLDAGAGFTFYNWSNGDSTQMTYAKATGMYSVQVTDTNGCSAEDSVFVSIINDSILQNDTIICKGDSVSLSISQPISQALSICNGNNLPSNLQTGLVGYWPFCGNANDESGNGNNGTVNGATLTTDRFGNANSAYDFDGNSNYIEVVSSSSISVSSNYALSAWYNSTSFPTVFPQEAAIVSKIANGNWYGGYEVFTTLNGSPKHTGNINGNFRVISTPTNLNNWYHVVATFDGAVVRFYLNGIKVDSLIRTGSLQTSNIPLRFGRRGGAGSYDCYFTGLLDDIGIWNRALSSSEVQQLYSSGAQQSYQWSTGDTTSTISVSPDSTTTYYVTISNGIHSCVDSVTVTVNNPQFQFAQDSVSGCDTVSVNAGSGWSAYSWSSGDTTQSVSFTTTGLKVLTVTDSIGCTATDSIYVTVNTYVTTTISDTSCDEYTWSQTGITYGSSGIYRDTVPTVVGCDSIIELVLTIHVSDTVRISTTACDSFTWSQTGLTYYTSGVYSDSLVNNQGCDSILLLDLTISQTTSSTISAAACDSFTWLLNGMTYNSSGVYSDTLTTSQGCDSIVSLNLTINTLSYQLPQDTITSCGQDSVLLDAGAGFVSYNWSNGDSTQMTYAKATGMYSVQVTDSNGCSAEDSVFVSIINDSILQNDTIICKGDSVSLGVSQPIGQALTICNGNNLPSNLQTGLVGYWPFCGNANDESGNGNNGTVFGATLTTDRFGNANSAYDFDGVNDYISLSQPYFNGGTSISSLSFSTWVKVDQFPASGATSHFIAKEGFWRTVSLRVNSLGKIYFGGSQPSPQGYFGITSGNNAISLNRWSLLTVTYNNGLLKLYINGILSATANISYSTLNFSYLAAGNSTSTNLIGAVNPVSPGVTNYVNGSIDDLSYWNRALSASEVLQLNGSVSGSSGSSNYLKTYFWSTGDTTSTISVSPDSTTTYYVTISNGIHSCVDSVTVTVNNPQFQFAQDSVSGCDTVSVNAGSGWSAYSWSSGDTTQSVSFTTTGLKVLTVTDSIGCTATDSIYVTVNTYVTTTISDTSCDEYTWSQTGITYGSSGIYRDTVPTVVGCDSIIELVLTIHVSDTVRIPITACDSFTWSQTGLTYYTSGVYSDSLVNNQGCDSILLLDLTISQTTNSIVSISACDSFTWLLNGMTYNSSGVYSDTITNSQGCDSIVSLNLTINTLSYQLPQDTITSCGQDSVLLDAGAGFASYNWSNGDSTQMTYAKATGMYSVQVADSNGCSAEDSVFVSIINDSILQNDTIICKGDSVSLSITITSAISDQWSLIIPTTSYDTSLLNFSYTGYDRTRNYIYSVYKRGGVQKIQRFELNTNSVTVLNPTGNSRSDVNTFAYDNTSNRIVGARAGRENISALNLSALSWGNGGNGTSDAQSYGGSYFWNPVTQKTSFFGGYGFFYVKNWVWENNGSNWSNPFTNNSSCGSVVPPKRTSHKLALSSINSNEIFIFSGQGSCSGQQTASSCSLGSAWATDVGIYCWLKDIWKYNMTTSTFSNVLPVNSSSVSKEGVFTFDYTNNTFYIIGGYTPSPTYNRSFGSVTNFENGVLRYRQGIDPGFIPISTTGTPPPVVKINDLGSNAAYYDAINKQLVWARKDGIFALSLEGGELLTYQWSTGDTTSTISVSPDSTTTYYVTISNGIHSCVDSVTVTVNNPQFQFAQDSVSGCDTVSVNAGSGWSAYSWSSGDTTQSVSFTTTGLKVLTVTDSIGCTATDSIYVTVNTYVTTTISDTSCDQYTWSQTGITYGSSGTYRDTVPTVVGCDSIIELVLTITNSSFSSDTVVACESYLWTQTGVTYFTTGIYFDTMLNAVGCDSIVALDLTIHYSTSSLVNQTACDSFSWPQTGLTYFVSGTYSDTVLNSNGCDSVVFLNLLVYPTITPIIGAVQNMCENDPVFNISSSPVGGVWSGPGVSPTGSFDPTVSGVGVHTIVYTAAGQCANSDTVTIEVFEVPLVDDRISDDECDEGKGSIELTISGGIPPYSYLWSNGKTSKDNLRLKEGTYSLTVTDSNGCIENYIGSLLNLEDDSCDDTYLFVPNVFSPDGNGVNDVLFVDGKNILSVNLQIYNRWGNLVFESNSLTKGWDAMYQGKPVNQGVFVYLVTGRYKDGEEFEQKGTITVVR